MGRAANAVNAVNASKQVRCALRTHVKHRSELYSVDAQWGKRSREHRGKPLGVDQLRGVEESTATANEKFSVGELSSWAGDGTSRGATPPSGGRA